MKSLCFDVESVVDSGTALIVIAPTGIFYEAQVGGVACNHPRVEGFVIGIGPLFHEFDDCSLICACWYKSDKLRIEAAAKEIDVLLREKTKNFGYKLEFDFSRIEQLQEGWWPVRVRGRWYAQEGPDFDHQAIIHTGNCD